MSARTLWAHRADGFYVLAVWLASRAIVLYAMLIVAPHAALPTNGHPATPSWDAFLYLDGPYYAAIGAHGYEYVADGHFHSIAFFPLYPLLTSAIVRATRLPFDIVGPIVSNAAFLAALFAIFAWARERQGVAVARWAVATMCALPLSIYGSLAYTEGLFALFSTLALRDFERQRFIRAGIWGALSSATRSTGVALVPAFLLWACLRRSPRALLAAILTSCGIALFALYCWLAFGDPLAFVHVQIAWRGDVFSRWWAWQHILDIFLGTIGPGYWPAQLAVAFGAALWWRAREWMYPWFRFASAVALAYVEYQLWFESPTTILLIVVGAVATIVYCRRLGIAATTYALAGIAIIVAAGYPVSADRIAFSIVPLTIALALLWQSVPGAGAVAVIVFVSRVPWDAIKIAQHIWWIR